MKIKVGKVTHNVGYALWGLGRLPGETSQEFLDRAVGIDTALRESDNVRTEKRQEHHQESLK